MKNLYDTAGVDAMVYRSGYNTLMTTLGIDPEAEEPRFWAKQGDFYARKWLALGLDWVAIIEVAKAWRETHPDLKSNGPLQLDGAMIKRASAPPSAPTPRLTGHDSVAMIVGQMQRGEAVGENWLFGENLIALHKSGLIDAGTIITYRNGAWHARKDAYPLHQQETAGRDAAERWRKEMHDTARAREASEDRFNAELQARGEPTLPTRHLNARLWIEEAMK
jgi:hypothetical protein